MCAGDGPAWDPLVVVAGVPVGVCCLTGLLLNCLVGLLV